MKIFVHLNNKLIFPTELKVKVKAEVNQNWKKYNLKEKQAIHLKKLLFNTKRKLKLLHWIQSNFHYYFIIIQDWKQFKL